MGMSIVIKRYRNRKLYNTQSKRYITLEEIEQLIIAHEDIKVIENDTGTDITAATLSQIIFELEKNETGVLPIDLLVSLVRSSGKKFEDIRKNIFTSLNFNRHFEIELERRMDQLIVAGDISQVEASELIKKLLPLGFKQENFFESIESKVYSFLKDEQIPTHDDLQSLIARLDDLSQMVDKLEAPTDSIGSEKAQNQIIE
jgi:polyhydroxyalkanoate synthesis repressor PhaR